MRARPRQRRRGAAVVEFAIVAPLLFTVVMGSIEFGRAMMALNLLSNAARNGARAGVIPGTTTQTTKTAATDMLTNAGVTGSSVNASVAVNGDTSADASSATTGDSISVTVSVSAGDVTWMPVSWFLGNATLSQTAVMRRE
jgi:Flp pilus assembly protein TadG